MLEKILALLQERGIEQQKLADYLGINQQVITDWKGGRSKSYRKYVGKIAEFFGISPDYLFNSKPIPSESAAQNKTEKRLLLLARKAADIPDEQRERIIKNFEDNIDIYLKARGIHKED